MAQTPEKLLKAYYPMPKFPPLSLSGRRCELNCRHCNRVYLRAMRATETQAALLETGHQLRKAGAIGALVSGGSTRNGELLNLKRMLPAIRRLKEETGLILNLHPGLMDAETAKALSGVVDFASLDIPSNTALRTVLGLSVTTDAYLETYRRLQAADIKVMPHITIFEGDEDQLLEPLSPSAGNSPPEVIVVIVFTPTRGTPMEDVPPPSAEAVYDVIRRLRTMFPDTEISLGCMRPRTKDLHLALELAALDAGATRMEMPMHQTLEIAQQRGYVIERFDACCALPRALENRARRPET